MSITETTLAPVLEFVMRLEVQIGPVLEIGATRDGQRRIIPITGGGFSGPDLNGRVLAGGGDWQTIRSNGVAEVHARYAIETESGGRIEIDNRGYRHGPQDVLERIAAGERVSPLQYYFQTTPVLLTADPGLDWVNHTIFLGSAQRFAHDVVVDVYAVRPHGFSIK